MSDKRKRQYYDEAFTEVFSNRTIIESLLRDFVGESWVELLDFDSMTIEPSVFKEIEKPVRSSDLLLSFKLQTGERFSIFVLIEFQSTPEPMTLRLLEYLCRIFERQMEQDGALSPAVPIVIYNGTLGWKETPRLRAHFTFLPEDLLPYIPDFEYILIDEHSLDDALLLELESAVGYFFYFDKTNVKEREKAAERIIDVLKRVSEKMPETYEVLRRYIIGLLAHQGVEIQEVNEYTIERRKPMLAQSMDELREEGKAEGKAEGELQEKQNVLIRLLSKRFGMTEEETTTIRACTSPEDLDNALDAILFAESKKQVLRNVRE